MGGRVQMLLVRDYRRMYAARMVLTERSFGLQAVTRIKPCRMPLGIACIKAMLRAQFPGAR